MKLKTIFNKQVNRPIEGVIKADANDEVSLSIELEEYVLTNEVEKRLEDFLEAFLVFLEAFLDFLDFLEAFLEAFLDAFLAFLETFLAPPT